MSGELSHGDLVTQIATNSHLTAAEIEEALDVLTSVVQAALQGGGKVDILGLGTFRSEGSKVTFDIGQSLQEIVSDPSIRVTLDTAASRLTGSPMADEIYKHKVNVNC